MVAYWFKIDLIDLYVEKSSFEIFGLKVVQNDQNEVFQVLWKVDVQNFSIFIASSYYNVKS